LRRHCARQFQNPELPSRYSPIPSNHDIVEMAVCIWHEFLFRVSLSSNSQILHTIWVLPSYQHRAPRPQLQLQHSGVPASNLLPSVPRRSQLRAPASRTADEGAQRSHWGLEHEPQPGLLDHRRVGSLEGVNRLLHRARSTTSEGYGSPASGL